MRPLCLSLRQWNAIAALDILNKIEYSYDGCPSPVFFKISLLIMYLSAIKTLICHTEIGVDRVYFLRFCTKYDIRFSKYGIEHIATLSLPQNATKRTYGLVQGG